MKTKSSSPSEIAITASCRHQNIVEFIDVCLVSDQVWLILEYVHGDNLTELLERYTDHPELRLKECHIAYICREV